MRGVCYALVTPKGSILGIFARKWKAKEAQRLWNYPHFTIRRVWVEHPDLTTFEITEHHYKRIRV